MIAVEALLKRLSIKRNDRFEAKNNNNKKITLVSYTAIAYHRIIRLYIFPRPHQYFQLVSFKFRLLLLLSFLNFDIYFCILVSFQSITQSFLNFHSYHYPLFDLSGYNTFLAIVKLTEIQRPVALAFQSDSHSLKHRV